MELIIKQYPQVLASLKSDGIDVFTPGGWTVIVNKAAAIAYEDDYNSAKSVNAGFFEVEGNVVFTHAGAKITFSPQEAQALRSAIRTGRDEYWS